MHVTYANLKVGSLPTSSCIFIFRPRVKVKGQGHHVIKSYFQGLACFDYSVLFKWHGSISTYCISLSFGISIYPDVRPKQGKIQCMKPDCKLGVCQSVVSLQVCQSVIASYQSANCMSVSHWQVCSVSTAHFNVNLLH